MQMAVLTKPIWCTAKFQNVMTQTPTTKQIIPFQISEKLLHTLENQQKASPCWNSQKAPTALSRMLRRCWRAFGAATDRRTNLPLHIAQEVAAGEQAARMAAMDNATRNAGDMINRLTLPKYNRVRQAGVFTLKKFQKSSLTRKPAHKRK